MPAWIIAFCARLLYQPTLRTAAKPEKSLLVRYGVAVLAVSLAVGVMLLIDPWIAMQTSPFLLFYGAVMMAAWYGGMGPGVLATILSTLCSAYFLRDRSHLWYVLNGADVVRLGLFALMALMISSLSAIRRQLLMVLQQERDLMAAIVNTAGSLIVVLDSEGRIVKFNRTCERITGYSSSAVQRRYVWDLLVPPEELKVVRGIVQNLLMQDPYQGILPSEYEGIWVTRNGDRHYITWSNTALRDAEGNVRYIISTGIDISDRRAAERHLEETNQMLQALVQASPLAISMLDRQGRVKLWNPAAERLFGWSAAAVMEQALPTIPTDRWAEFQANLESTLRGELLNGIEVRHQGKGGITVHIELWTAVLRGSQAEDDSIICIMADLGERKRAEAALSMSQARLTSFMEANIIGILFGDIDGGIHQANDAFLHMLGYSQAELARGEVRWTDITPPEYLPLDAERIAEAQSRGACTPYEKEYITKAGDRTPVLVGYTLLGAERRESVAFILDLSERKQLEQALRSQAEELAQANRLKDEFLAVLSHELRTPLNSMLGWSRLLRTRQLDGETTARALETIERNARLQAQLIEDILDTSKIIQGKLRLQLYPVDLVAVITAAVDAMRPAATAKTVQLDCRLDQAVSRVSGDADRLQQVVWNLLANAIKFTPEGGHVIITLVVIQGRRWMSQGARTEHAPSISMIDAQKTQISYAQITVSDNGKGISPDFLPFVFDRFRQADSTTTRSEGGLGLGLAIVRHLVELHGGKVWAESAGLGKGATFIVRLPLLSDRPERDC